MSLGPRAGRLRAAAFRVIPLVCALATAASAERPVYPDPESVQPLAPGARVPAVTVHTVSGAPVDLAEVVRERGALLVFYRGGW